MDSKKNGTDLVEVITPTRVDKKYQSVEQSFNIKRSFSLPLGHPYIPSRQMFQDVELSHSLKAHQP